DCHVRNRRVREAAFADVRSRQDAHDSWKAGMDDRRQPRFRLSLRGVARCHGHPRARWRRTSLRTAGRRSLGRPSSDREGAQLVMADIKYSDDGFEAETFVALAKRVWPRDYDLTEAAAALTRTTNIGAWDGERLVGAVRILTDGYFFATVPEILVDPDY